jgi:hypothetical protein
MPPGAACLPRVAKSTGVGRVLRAAGPNGHGGFLCAYTLSGAPSLQQGSSQEASAMTDPKQLSKPGGPAGVLQALIVGVVAVVAVSAAFAVSLAGSVVH